MQGDPYANLADPAPVDPYAGVAEEVHPSELPFEQRNAMLQEHIRKPGVTAADALNYAQTLGLNITGHLDENLGKSQARVVPDPEGANQVPGVPGNRVVAAGRQLANGVTAGFADKFAAAADAVIPLDALIGGDVHSIWDGSNFGDAYRHNLGLQQGQTNADDAAHPFQSVGMNALGALVSPVAKGSEAVFGAVRGTGLAARATRALAPDIAYGATYGVGSSNADTAGGLTHDALVGGAFGGAGSVIGQGLSRLGGRIVGGIVNPAVRVLRDSGVSTTIGQTLGGMANRMEAKLTSVPFLGDMIAARRGEAGASLINAPLNRALAPIKEKLPPDVTGSESLQYAQTAFDRVYDQARAGMALSLDKSLKSDLTRLQLQAQGQGSTSLSTEYAKKFKGLIEEDVLRRLNGQGTLNGEELNTVVSSLKAKAAKYTSGNNSAEAQEFGEAVNNLVGVLNNAAARNPASSPEALALKRQADRGYRYLVLAQNAAKRRGGDAGTVTASQLDAAVQQMDRTARNNAFSRNRAFGQDLSNAAKEVMPNVPNSFSADRYLAARLLGAPALSLAGAEGAHQLGFDPMTGALIGAAALPYSRGGNALIVRGLIDRPAAFRRAGPMVERAFRPYLGSVGAVEGARRSRR